MAKGSHATLGGWEPKRCALCGHPIYVTKHSAWYHRTPHSAFALHVPCWNNNPQRVHQLLEEADRGNTHPQ